MYPSGGGSGMRMYNSNMSGLGYYPPAGSGGYPDYQQHQPFNQFSYQQQVVDTYKLCLMPMSFLTNFAKFHH